MEKALFGFGGHAREVMCQMGIKLPCFVDDKFVCENTIPFSKFNPEKYQIMIACADSKDRFDIVKRLPKKTKFFSFIHPTTLILDDNIVIGEGSFIGAYSILTTNIKLGKHTILNRSNQIGHDTVSGDFLSMMPGSVISGNCSIGNRVYLGTNSSIREKTKICDDVIIGLNSGVVKDIKKSGIYGGIPSTKIK
jgi:sugar O-acyltransferase (sialic acid O-acetyltransferase NeuD family)